MPARPHTATSSSAADPARAVLPPPSSHHPAVQVNDVSLLLLGSNAVLFCFQLLKMFFVRDPVFGPLLVIVRPIRTAHTPRAHCPGFACRPRRSLRAP